MKTIDTIFRDPAYGSPPVMLYDYAPSQDAKNPRAFLKGYKGLLHTDGYQVCHELENESPEDLLDNIHEIIMQEVEEKRKPLTPHE